MFRPRACQPANNLCRVSAGFYGFPAPLRSAAELRLGRPGAATPKHLTHQGLRERPEGARAFPRGHRPTTRVGASDDFGMKKLTSRLITAIAFGLSLAAVAQANPAARRPPLRRCDKHSRITRLGRTPSPGTGASSMTPCASLLAATRLLTAPAGAPDPTRPASSAPAAGQQAPAQPGHGEHDMHGGQK